MTITCIGLKFNFSIWEITPIPLKLIQKIKIPHLIRPTQNLKLRLTSKSLIKLMLLEREVSEK